MMRARPRATGQTSVKDDAYRGAGLTNSSSRNGVAALRTGLGAAAALLAAFLAGCTTTGGTGTGGASDMLTGLYVDNGAKSGDQKPSVPVIGGMAGGIAAGQAGAGLGRADRRLALEAEYKALEYTPGGQQVSWQNSDGSSSGEVIAAQPYRVGSQDCRQYSHTVHVGGRTTIGRGTACRNEDGSWTLLT